MKEIDCNVIQDLLPLYEDNVASQETQELIREHLKDCPVCREQLRKMRTPVSLPPEEDKELWKKFVQRRVQLRRKRNIKIACVVSVLAAAVLFCLWYIWPRSWTKITGENASLQSGWLTMRNFYWYAETPEEKLNYDHWNLTDEDVTDNLNDTVFDILERYTFRGSLSRLVPRDNISLGGGDVLCLVIRQGEQDLRRFQFSNNGKMIASSGHGWDVYYYDPALFNSLAEVLKEYGTLQED